MRRALVIVGKAPTPGRSKTRLVPPLHAQQAADLARAFLLDTVGLGLRLGWERVTVVHPATAADSSGLAALLPHGVQRRPQHGTGLGDALAGAFATHLREGFERVVLIGSDTPNLPPSLVNAACDALDQDDMSIGPCADGGWYLLGLRRMCAQVFENVAWSTAAVYAQTLERAAEARLCVQPVPSWYDVDNAEDLWRLHVDLQNQPSDVAAHTRGTLEQLDLATTVSAFR
jgi:rSAM/selenodomain-associated transferase 1